MATVVFPTALAVKRLQPAATRCVFGRLQAWRQR
jgi:hypothetical protein